MSLDGITAVDEVVPLAGAIGGGTITAGCANSHGLCSTCLEIKNVDYDSEDHELSYSFRAVTNCAGVRTTIDLGSTSVTDCIRTYPATQTQPILSRSSYASLSLLPPWLALPFLLLGIFTHTGSQIFDRPHPHHHTLTITPSHHLSHYSLHFATTLA